MRLSMWMFFLTQMWTVLAPLLACSLLIFLSFDIVMVARQLWTGSLADMET
jgi:hypothetical protein